MKDIPIFTTEFGVASLILREVPYQQKAYIRLHSALEPVKLLQECISFCRMVGAEAVYAAGEEVPEDYPMYTDILQMAASRDSLGDTDAALWPVQEHTVAEYRRIYNEKVNHIPGAAWMTASEEKELVSTGEGYFIHRGDTLLGIGRVSGEEIRFLCAVQPGAGKDVVRALNHGLTGDRVLVEVASANLKAVGLYQQLGFVQLRMVCRWYQVFPK